MDALYLLGFAVVLFAAWYKLFRIGGTVREKKHCRCEEEPEVIFVRFEPLEVNIKVEIINPEPDIKAILKLGPVSEKKE